MKREIIRRPRASTDIFLFACLSALLMSPVHAAVIRVRADAPGPGRDGQTWQSAFPTVTDALAAAQPGDELWVAAATYPERITLRPSVSLYGGFSGGETGRDARDPYANATTLQPVGGSVVRVSAGVGRDTVLDGFNLRGGTGTASGPFTFGGGVLCQGGSPTIRNNVIMANSAGYGGGLACRAGAAPLLERNRIEQNEAAAYQGGGIYCEGSSPAIRDNVIRGNRGGSLGGGIACAGSAAPVIEGNLIAGNRSGYNGGGIGTETASPTVRWNVIRENTALVNGGGVFGFQQAGVIENNRILGNVADTGGGIQCISSGAAVRGNWIGANGAGWGGGLALAQPANARVDGNTIVANSAFDPSYNGSGAVYLNGGIVALVNNIIAFNESGVRMDADTAATLRYNCVHGNAEYDFQGLADPTGTNGNIAADPRLAFLPGGDLHIQPDSPCLDAGEAEAPAEGETDVDGQPRLQGDRRDIGADESDGTVWDAAPRVVRVRPDGSDTNDGSAWDRATKTVGAALEAVALAGGGEVWLAQGTYPESAALHGFVTVLGGFAGDEAAASERDPARHRSILTGSLEGGVAFDGGWRSATLEGVAITSGPASGALPGIICSHASPVIRGNDIAATKGVGISCGRGSKPLITENTIRDSERGGISCLYSAPVIQHNVIRGNIGGISCAGADPQILDNIITGNYYSLGGGIFCNDSSPLIVRNIITDNVGGGGAGGITANGAPRIQNNVLLRNTPTAISCNGPAQITNNTIADNVGVGVSVMTSLPLVVNNIIAFNTAGVTYTGPQSQGPVLRANCVYGNRDGDYAGVVDPTGFFGNIQADPRFAGLYENNVHIQPDSPCVDAGESATDLGPTDMDGQSRVQGARMDIGADESDGTQWNVTRRILHVRPDGDDANDGATWETAMRSLDAAGQAAMNGADIWVAAGSYGGAALGPLTRTLGGFNGTETDVSQRDPGANPTVIVAAPSGLAVSLRGSSSSTVFDGFTVRGGTLGGLFLQASAALIQNCIVEGSQGVGIQGGYAPVIRNCFIRDSTGAGIYGQWAGGVVEDTTLSANKGGGMVVGGEVAIRRCRVLGGGSPIGIRLTSARAVVENSLVVDHASQGIWAVGGSARLVNNTVASNGVGVDVKSAPGAEVINNVVAFNNVGILATSGLQSLLNNDVYANGLANYQGIADPNGAGGNRTADPLFRNMAAGDYRLTPLSPAVEGGYNPAAPNGAVDLDGNPRVVGPRVDIGAYEFQGDDTIAFGDVRRALSIAAGLARASARDTDRLDVDTAAPDGITLPDVAALARRAAGLQP